MSKPKAYCVYWRNITTGAYGNIYTIAWSKEAAFKKAMRYLKPNMWYEAWLDVWVEEVI